MGNLTLISKPPKDHADHARAARPKMLQWEVMTGSGGGGLRLRELWRGLLAFCCVISVALIGVGMDRVFPQVRAGRTATERATAHKAAGRTRPYASCEAARAAGVHDIPRASPLYAPDQDKDGNGLACEPVRQVEGAHLGVSDHASPPAGAERPPPSPEGAARRAG